MVKWLAKVGCAGGPLLVCDVSAFAAWGGAVLDEDYELDPACDLRRANAVRYPSDDEEFEAGFVHFGPSDARTGLVREMDGSDCASPPSPEQPPSRDQPDRADDGSAALPSHVPVFPPAA